MENRDAVKQFFATYRPAYVFIAAAKVMSPAQALAHPVDLLDGNIRLVSNLLHAAYTYGAKKVLLIGSLYAYPRVCSDPVTEDMLYTGTLDTPMQFYGMAKRTVIALCSAYNTQYHIPFITVIPPIVYGPKDMRATSSEKPIIQLIKAIHTAHTTGAQSVILPVSPTTTHEYLSVNDFADACLYVMQYYDKATPLNIGGGIGITNQTLAELIAQEIGYTGTLFYDPVGHYQMPAHVYNVDTLIQLGWQPQTTLREGFQLLIEYLKQKPLQSEYGIGYCIITRDI